MKLPWKREASLIQPRIGSIKQQELEAAKQILAEVFHARPADVEEMILRRLEELNPCHHHQEYQDGLWPAEFCLGE